ncbi:YkoF family thiamine/hydroxymethylpyrimidine-binding protein [Pseudactinotalea sp.]|uniref:YkoF family thiamine/hydroxymethylpyrimidine-binding protein n=1 Tax=Pseudactinotalea sp. TaxID=1926260 RepID=UPI003B3AA5DB
MNTTPSTPPDPIAAAAALGVGARITLSVMSDDYVRVITDALTAVDSSDLEVDTDKVSTFVRGSEERIATYVRDLITAAARAGHHLVATLMFSRGCPGEVCGVMPSLRPATPDLAPTDLHVQAQWSLYPLLDPVDGADSPIADHLAPVWAAIERSRERGTFVRGEHFATTLAGDLADVLTTVVDTWLAVGEAVPHVVTHVTISANSPATSAGLR